MVSKLIVQKYGGSSVANIERLENVAKRVIESAKKRNRLVVVVSAMGDTTDELLELSSKINPNPSEREMDMLVSTGEQISCALLAMAIHKRGLEAISFTGPQVGIITDTFHTRAKILRIETARIKEELKRNKIVIVAGFQGLSTALEITTLGRGGSDLSAVAMAAALGADMCEIYTDVEGIFTADPRIVPQAKKLKYITFDEMLELAARGAQVMQTRAVEVAKKFNIPLVDQFNFYKKGWDEKYRLPNGEEVINWHTDDAIQWEEFNQKISELKDTGEIKDYKINPQDVGIRLAKPSDLIGGTPAQNSRILLDILSGKEKGPKRDIVLINAAAGLYLGRKARDLKEGIKVASQCIDSGNALKKVELLRKFSQQKDY